MVPPTATSPRCPVREQRLDAPTAHQSAAPQTNDRTIGKERLCAGHTISRVGRRPPDHPSAGHCFWPQAQRVETEVILQFVPQELTDLGPTGAGTESLEERGEHAVVLVLHIVSDAHRIPLIEQKPPGGPGGGGPRAAWPRPAA